LHARGPAFIIGRVTTNAPGAGNSVQTEFVPERAAGLSAETQHVPDLPSFGRYRAISSLGAGGMGTVYRAEDEVLGRPVAIKVLHSHGDPAARERFLREARAFGAVPHANILAIYDAGTSGEIPYLVMELAAGGSLRDQLKAGPLDIETVRGIGIQISRALAAAHAAGILHRDVKPGNILAVEGGRWKLADFGIARLPDSQLTTAGQFLGSPSYAAPESLGAGQFSPAADVYGLGVTLYEALTGAPPHGDHDMSSLLRKLDSPAPPLGTRRAVPPSLEAAIMAALELDPAQRPSAEELANRLAAFEDSMIGAPAAAPIAAPVAFAGGAPVAFAGGAPVAFAGGAPVAFAGGAPGTMTGTAPGIVPGIAFGTATGTATGASPVALPVAAAIASPGAAPAPTSRRGRRLLVAALLVAAVVALAILAGGGGDGTPAAAGARDPRAPAGAPAESGTPGTSGTSDQDREPTEPEPQYQDQYGNPIDPETARRLLEQQQQQQRGPGRGRGRGKKHKGGD
jgi:eukaryotic-like serine/threonine-protein kinase